MDARKKTGIILIGLALFLSLIMSIGGGEEPQEAQEIKVKEIIVERDVKKEVLSITAVETVCHRGGQHHAIYYQKPDGSEAWFINGVPKPKACDGEEKIHPATRDKVLKAEKERKKQKAGET